MRPVLIFPSVTILECAARRVMVATWRQSPGGGLRCLGSSVQPLSGEIATETDWLAATVVSIQALGFPSGPVVLVLPPERTLTKMLTLPPSTPGQREKLIRYELGQSVPIALAELVWGSVPAGATAGDGLTAVFAAKKTVVESLCTAAESAGLTVQAVWASPLAGLAAFQREVTVPLFPSLFVMPTGTATVLACCETRRWALRVAVGEARAAETLSREITRTHETFATQHGFAHPQRIYLSEGAKHDEEQLATSGGLPIERWSVSNFVTDPDAEPPSIVMIGAAVLGLRRGVNTADLLSPERQVARAQRRLRPWLLAAAALVIAAWVPALIEAQQRLTIIQGRNAALARELVGWRARADRMRESAARLASAQTEFAAWSEFAGERTQWVRLLADWQQRLVAEGDVWLETVRCLPGESGGQPRLAVSGWLLDRENSRDGRHAALLARVQQLRASLASSPFVATVVAERYDTTRPGQLRFDWVFTSEHQNPL